MKMKNKGKRGFTLTELVVVIAVLAIISTMVVSFAVMVNGSQRLAKAKVDALGDIRLAESVIEGFIVDASNLDNSATCLESETKLVNSQGETLICDGANLHIDRAGTENDSKLAFDSIIAIKFSSHGSTDIIYYCKITYEVGDHNYDYTFCVNPYAGESI